MSDILVHDYLGINLDLVWELIEKELEPLKLQFETAMQALEDSP